MLASDGHVLDDFVARRRRGCDRRVPIDEDAGCAVDLGDDNVDRTLLFLGDCLAIAKVRQGADRGERGVRRWGPLRELGDRRRVLRTAQFAQAFQCVNLQVAALSTP